MDSPATGSGRDDQHPDDCGKIQVAERGESLESQLPQKTGKTRRFNFLTLRGCCGTTTAPPREDLQME